MRKQFLAAAGVYAPAFTAAEVAARQPAGIVLSGGPSSWPTVVAKLLEYLSKPIIEALKWLAALVNELYQPIDTLLEKACAWLGFCTKGA